MLKRLIYALIKAASVQHNIGTIYLNDVFNLNNHPDIDYGAFCITQDTHQDLNTQDGYITFNFILYYIDRLTIKKDNDVDVQSAGIDTLRNILRLLEEDNDGCEVSSVNYTTFNQRFKDECAGAFARVSISWPASNNCADPCEGDFNIDFSDDFFIRIRRS